MRTHLLSQVTIAAACALAVPVARANAAAPLVPDPCTLLTPVQINSVAGLAVAAGKPIIAGKSCQWIAPAPKHGVTTLDFWPAESWAKMKANWAAASQTVSGAGDEAFYVNAGTYGALSVKKGTAVFILKVYGIAPDKQVAILKTLANDVIANL
jgi:hypothetical protein